MSKVVLKSDIASDADLVWKAISNFQQIALWNPLIETIETTGEGVGSERTIDAKGAGVFVERLESLDDGTRTYTYSVVDSPLALTNCTVHVSVSDNGDGTSTVEWSSEFDTPPNQELKTVRAFQQLYQEALNNLGKLTSTARKR